VNEEERTARVSYAYRNVREHEEQERKGAAGLASIIARACRAAAPPLRIPSYPHTHTHTLSLSLSLVDFPPLASLRAERTASTKWLERERGSNQFSGESAPAEPSKPGSRLRHATRVHARARASIMESDEAREQV
jgi:hypothetical protein